MSLFGLDVCFKSAADLCIMYQLSYVVDIEKCSILFKVYTESRRFAALWFSL